MAQDKIVFIIPGYRHKATNKAYTAIAQILKRQGYASRRIAIPWKQTTISENTAYFLQKYKKIHAKKKYILGFSYGAMIAFLAATKVSVHGLILCSLSPYFQEDLRNIKIKKISPMQLERYQDFATLHSGKLAKKIKAKQILMMYGASEEQSLIKRVKKTYGQITLQRKQLISIDQTEHNIADKKYLQQISLVAKVLH